MKAVFRNRISSLEEPDQSTAAVEAPQPSGRDLLEVAWRGRWLVLLSVVICLAAALAYLKRATPQYTSSARIFVEQSGPKLIQTGDGVMSQQGNYLPTQVEVLKSPTITSIAVESGAFENMKTFAGLNSPLGMIKADLDVDIGKNNDIITLSFTGPYPSESADIVNRLVDAYKTYQSRQKRSTAAEVVKLLQTEKDRREQDREAKLKEKLDFMKDNSDLLLFQSDSQGGDKASPVLQRLNALTEALTTAQLATMDARANYEMAKAAVSDPTKLHQLMLAQTSGLQPSQGSAAIDPAEAQLRAQVSYQLMQTQSDLQDTRQRLMDNHPTVRMLEARVQRLQQQLDLIDSGASVGDLATRFGEAYLATAEQRWQMAQLKQKDLEATFGKSLQEQQKAAVEGNNKAATYAILDADYRRLEKLCDELQTRINEIHVTEDAGAMNVTVLEWARPPSRPSKPDRVRTLSLALLLGVALGLSMSLIMVWTDHRFRSADEVRATLGVPVLGAVPAIEGDVTPSARGRAVELAPSGDVAESYRTIRTGIYFGLPDDKSKTLLVTSPQPGDGKSTSASNLAIAMAKAGRRTLLLDADFRRPMQHKIYQVEATTGISDVIAGTSSLAEVIRPSGIANLDILPCGPVPQNPAEMLNSDLFAEAIAVLAQQYDHIILDSAPVLPVTDARILAALCDSTILVLRAQKSTRKAAEYARDMLRSTGAEICGVVVNGVSRNRGRYGYGAGYGYYYYGYGNKVSPKLDAQDSAIVTGQLDKVDIYENEEMHESGNGHANGQGHTNGGGKRLEDQSVIGGPPN